MEGGRIFFISVFCCVSVAVSLVLSSVWFSFSGCVWVPPSCGYDFSFFFFGLSASLRGLLVFLVRQTSVAEPK